MVLLFELEGVIAETLPVRAAALRSALQAEGIAATPEDAIDLSRARSVRRAVAAAAHDARTSYDLVTVDLVASQAERHFAAAAAAGGITLTPGAVAFVRAAQAGARCGLVTRASRAEADLLLRLAGLEDAFECVITHEDVVEEKPAPAPYRAALARLARKRGVAPGSAVALEDGGDGARAARAAGIVSLVVGPAPASEAVEADGYLPGLEGATMELVRALAARAGATAS
ncbi:MAG: HAD family phosphatase [Gemmatimonadaceae bacterium]|nr:HAD family phosphatase [Gemmatimonadaceae bacterium]